MLPLLIVTIIMILLGSWVLSTFLMIIQVAMRLNMKTSRFIVAMWIIDFVLFAAIFMMAWLRPY